MQYAAGTKAGVIFLKRSGELFSKALIVTLLGFFLRIEVIKIAKELVKAMNRWQMFIAVAQMVFAKLPGAIALLFQKLCQCRAFLLQAKCRARLANRRHA